MKQRLAKQKKLGLVPDDVVPAPHLGPNWDSVNEKKRDDLDSIMAAYAGCIDSIDQNVGKFIKHLEQIGRRENTIVFLLSDNGACQEGGKLGRGSLEMVKDPPLETTNGVRLGMAWANACNTPFRLYKHFIHEGGACTPCIVSWPMGIDAARNGSIVGQFGYLPDFMATCLDLAKGEYPPDLPECVGKSLVPVLKGNQAAIHTEPIYWEHEGNAGVWWGKWKLVRVYEEPWELFDMEADRTEMNNLAASHPEKLNEMIKLWTTWARRHQVAFPQRFNMYEFLKKRKKQD